MANLDVAINVEDKTKYGVQSAKRSLGILDGSVRRIGNAAKFAALGLSGLTIAGVGVGVSLAKDFIQAGVEMDRFSFRTGHSGEQISKMAFAAKTAGLELEDLVDVTEEMRIKAFDATEGSEAMAAHFKELGINAKEFLDLNADEQFNTLTTALHGVEDATRQTILADELLSDSGKRLLTVINSNADGFDGWATAAEAAGAVIDDEYLENIGELQATYTDTTEKMKGLVRDGFEALLPNLIDAGTKFNNLITDVIGAKDEFGNLKDQGISPVEAAIKAFGSVLVGEEVAGNIAGFAKVVVDLADNGLSKLESAFNTAKTAIDNILGSVDKVTNAFREEGLTGAIKAAVGIVTEKFNELKTSIKDGVDNVRQKVAGVINIFEEEGFVGVVTRVVDTVKGKIAELFSSSLKPTKDDYAAFISETSGSGSYAGFVAERRIREMFGIPEDADNILFGMFQSAWTYAQTQFTSWVESGEKQIREWFYIPEDETILQGLKAWWPVVKSSFESWLYTGEKYIRDWFYIPDNETVMQGLKIWWTIIKSSFITWIDNANEKIKDWFSIPEGTTIIQQIKDWWSGVKSTFTGWLTTAGEKIRDYFDIPDSASFLQALQIIWTSVKSGFNSWIESAKEWISDYIRIPTASEVIESIKDFWGGENGVRAKFESWMETAGEKISDFFAAPTVHSVIRSFKGLWSGDDGVKANFEQWVEKPENRIVVPIGLEFEEEEEENVGFFTQFRNTIGSIVNAIFSDIDFEGALVAPLALLFQTDVEDGFGGIVEKITGFLKSIEEAANSVDTAIDNFFENFNPDTIGELISPGLEKIKELFNIFSSGAINGFQILWEFISGIFTSAWESIRSLTEIDLDGIITWITDTLDEWKENTNTFLTETIPGLWTDGFENIKTNVSTKWEEIKTFLSGEFDLFKQGVSLFMIQVGLEWTGGWDSIKETISTAWTSIKSTASSMFGTFGTWVTSMVRIIGDGVITAVNGVIRVINSFIRLTNIPLKAWNELSLNIGGFSKSFNNPFTGEHLGSIGWGGVDLHSRDVELLKIIPSIGNAGEGQHRDLDIPELARGGIVRQPTLALIGENGPERVEPLNASNSGRSVTNIFNFPQFQGSQEEMKAVIISAVNEAKLDGALI